MSSQRTQRRIGWFAVVLAAITAMLSGCRTRPDRAARMRRSYVYYLDGAGGSGVVTDWSRGVRRGLVDAGYDGAGEVFRWQTGLGAPADQASSVAYKRSKGEQLSQKIDTFRRNFPESQVNLIGFSAGTPVAVFALEALPETIQVDNVVLLGASLSQGYDLTEALSHVRHRIYVFTSEHDGVLRFLVPLTGTADRKAGTVPAGGIRGFKPPRNPSREAMSQYRKLVHIRWSKEFREQGHRGGHTDAVTPGFIRGYVVPLMAGGFSSKQIAGTRDGDDLVENPDFKRWRDFAPGSWMRLQARQTLSGKQRKMTVVERLVFGGEARLYLERMFEPDPSYDDRCPIVRGFFEHQRTSPADHPRTHPEATVVELPSASVSVHGHTLRCRGTKLEVKDGFADWGSDIKATVFSNQSVPGGIVQIDLAATLEGQPAQFRGRLVDFHARPQPVAPESHQDP